MAQRSRNGLLSFIQDDAVRSVYEEFLCDWGWQIWSASAIDDALRGFGQLGDRLGLVICDDIRLPGPGRKPDREGVNLLIQCQPYMTAQNIPFALFIFEGVQGVIDWADKEMGGLAVRMPYAGRVAVLMDTLDQLERDHPRPRKPETCSNEQ